MQILEWQEHKNDVTINCSLDIAVTPSKSGVVLLVIPGVDGSLDGYENKYKRIAETVHEQHGVSVVRMSNPFISSFHWESNIMHILEFINSNKNDIAGSDDIEIRVMAHSAGASVISQLAYDYPSISKMLLINPATKLGTDKIKQGLSSFAGYTVMLISSDDPSRVEAQMIADQYKSDKVSTVIVEGADHNFSGIAFSKFLNAPNEYLFEAL